MEEAKQQNKKKTKKQHQYHKVLKDYILHVKRIKIIPNAGKREKKSYFVLLTFHVWTK